MGPSESGARLLHRDTLFHTAQGPPTRRVRAASAARARQVADSLTTPLLLCPRRSAIDTTLFRAPPAVGGAPPGALYALYKSEQNERAGWLETQKQQTHTPAPPGR